MTNAPFGEGQARTPLPRYITVRVVLRVVPFSQSENGLEITLPLGLPIRRKNKNRAEKWVSPGHLKVEGDY